MRWNVGLTMSDPSPIGSRTSSSRPVPRAEGHPETELTEQGNLSRAGFRVRFGGPRPTTPGGAEPSRDGVGDARGTNL